MKIFVMGASHSGKTPLAETIAQTLGFQLISAGEWAKRGFDVQCASMEEYVKKITQYSVDRLREQFDAGIAYLRSTYDLALPCVIEGERNPYDFVSLFDCRYDFAITLRYRQNPVPSTTYETGLAVIASYLEWLADNELIKPFQDRRYSFDCLYIRQCSSRSQSSLEQIMPGCLRKLQMDIARLQTS